jgi:hypothetical protein
VYLRALLLILERASELPPTDSLEGVEVEMV